MLFYNYIGTNSILNNIFCKEFFKMAFATNIRLRKGRFLWPLQLVLVIFESAKHVQIVHCNYYKQLRWKWLYQIHKLVLSSFNLIIYCSQCRYFFSTPAFSSVLFTSMFVFVFTLFQLKIVVVVFCCIFWVRHECCFAVSLDNNDMAVFFFCFCYVK